MKNSEDAALSPALGVIVVLYVHGGFTNMGRQDPCPKRLTEQMIKEEFYQQEQTVQIYITSCVFVVVQHASEIASCQQKF